MAKKHWTEAPANIRRLIERKLDAPATVRGENGEQFHCAAIVWAGAASLAWTSGYDFDPPDTGTADEYLALRETDPSAAIHFRRRHAIAIAQEERNRLRWQGMRKWATEPSREEQAVADAAAREAEAKREAVERRALEIMADEQAKALARARAKATKELEGVA